MGPLYIHQNKQLINYLNISNSYIHFKISKGFVLKKLLNKILELRRDLLVLFSKLLNHKVVIQQY